MSVPDSGMKYRDQVYSSGVLPEKDQNRFNRDD